jgi:hypothetical protein
MLNILNKIFYFIIQKIHTKTRKKTIKYFLFILQSESFLFLLSNIKKSNSISEYDKLHKMIQ